MSQLTTQARAQAKKYRAEKWVTIQTVYQEKSAIFEKNHEDITKEEEKLEAEKLEVAQKYGNTNADDSDIIEFNVGGKIISLTRGVLTQLKGTMLEALFGGRWDKKLQYDEKGRIFLDLNPICFQSILDYLVEKQLSTEDNPPKIRCSDFEHKYILLHMMKYLGVDEKLFSSIQSEIVTDPYHQRKLHEWLDEDGFDGEIQLLYRASRDGWKPSLFHAKCDNQGATLTVIKSSEGYVFGVFTDTPWSQNKVILKSSPKDFAFALHSHSGLGPTKMNLKKCCSSGHRVYHSPDNGPCFAVERNSICINIKGFSKKVNPKECNMNVFGTFQCPAGQNASNFFTENNIFIADDVEVFCITNDKNNVVTGATKTRHRAKIQEKLSMHPKTYSCEMNIIDELPDGIKEAMSEEQKVLDTAKQELQRLRYNFRREKDFIGSFCKGSTEDIVNLNVSGTKMSTKRSTLRLHKDSVLARQFDNTVWTQQGANKNIPIKEWNHEQVVQWAKKRKEIPDEVAEIFEKNKINGMELLAFGREDLRELGINRTGNLAIVNKAIKDLKTENKGNVTFIEQSPYFFGKILDQLRLQAMPLYNDDGMPPLHINASELDQFEKVVDFYFPGELSAKIGLAEGDESNIFLLEQVSKRRRIIYVLDSDG